MLAARPCEQVLTIDTRPLAVPLHAAGARRAPARDRLSAAIVRPVARSWAELLGEADAAPEPEEERAGLFGRLRDSLSKSRRALTGEIASATFDPGNEADWERLEEALIMGDVGVRATAELVRRLEARGELTSLNDALAEEVAALLGEPRIAARRRAAERDPRRRRQRHRQDDDDRQARREARASTATRSSSPRPTPSAPRRRSSSRSGRSAPAPTSSARRAAAIRRRSPTTRSRRRRRAAATSSSSTRPAGCTRRRT